MERMLVTGALGQIGSELVPALRVLHGAESVVASDVRVPADAAPAQPFAYVDCTHIREIDAVVRQFGVTTIYHLAAILSAAGERAPRVAWDVNMGGLFRVLEVARHHGCRVFFPSSIGAFGPETPPEDTPQDTVQRPRTIYGITKVAGELLADYYSARFGVDARGLRFPGLVSYVAPPGGGTTDYAVDMFRQALRYGKYVCFLRPDTRLPMMYMPDAIRAVTMLMAADAGALRHRNAFNVAAMSFTPAELAHAVAAHIPGFTVEYDIDPVRQAIADSWPRSIDDSAARHEWGWAPQWDLQAMTDDMLLHLHEGSTEA
ncbi:MAG: NAD-dependent epimerase/dehydratase family protein [Dehalococcoidia bacterium]